MPAQMLAQTRPGTKGALMFSAALPPEEFGGPWPEGVPLQIHMMEDDEWVDEDLPAARQIVETVESAELFLYPGDRHLFADESLPTTTKTPRNCSWNARSASSTTSNSSARSEAKSERARTE